MRSETRIREVESADSQRKNLLKCFTSQQETEKLLRLSIFSRKCHISAKTPEELRKQPEQQS